MVTDRTVTITIRIPRDIAEYLKKRAEEDDITLSEAARNAIWESMGRSLPRRAPPSGYEALGPAAEDGIIGGPRRDLPRSELRSSPSEDDLNGHPSAAAEESPKKTEEPAQQAAEAPRTDGSAATIKQVFPGNIAQYEEALRLGVIRKDEYIPPRERIGEGSGETILGTSGRIRPSAPLGGPSPPSRILG